ncbi:MAG: 4-phosphoerythronate dehydrogenase [Rikenellaceae bacterium]
MKIVVDSAIPFIRGVLEPYADVVYLRADSIDRAAVQCADALIIRTRTQCNANLLDGSNVHLIATATIGYDHIDLEYCAEHNIAVTTAAGCNAGGVLQWVAASLRTLLDQWGAEPRGLKLGVVGVGNVGRLVEMHAAHWGFEVLCCDPPRAEREADKVFFSLEELLPQVDILTLHTPLNISTRELINIENIKLLQPHAAIINSSRGEVLSNDALHHAPAHPLLLDVWSNEPNIDRSILARSLVSTFHIAGYSLQGKANATAISIGAVARYFDLPLEGWYPNGVEASHIALTSWGDLSGSYDIVGESMMLKSNPDSFEQLRTGYTFRNEVL